jgi:hypothetical protein
MMAEAVTVRKLFTRTLLGEEIEGEPLPRKELRGKDLVWDSRVRVQNFLTEDTGRGHSLGSEIEGWFASV